TATAHNDGNSANAAAPHRRPAGPTPIVRSVSATRPAAAACATSPSAEIASATGRPGICASARSSQAWRGNPVGWSTPPRNAAVTISAPSPLCGVCASVGASISSTAAAIQPEARDSSTAGGGGGGGGGGGLLRVPDRAGFRG